MTAGFNQISNWFDNGINERKSYMLVVCDTYDHNDYPVYIKRGEDPKKAVDKYQNESMQTVMEVYDLCIDKFTQMKEHPAWHLPE